MVKEASRLRDEDEVEVSLFLVSSCLFLSSLESTEGAAFDTGTTDDAAIMDMARNALLRGCSASFQLLHTCFLA